MNPPTSFLTLRYINFSSLSSWLMKQLLQSVSQGAIDDESSEANTPANGTLTSVNDNLLLDINNSPYYFTVNSVKMMLSQS